MRLERGDRRRRQLVARGAAAPRAERPRASAPRRRSPAAAAWTGARGLRARTYRGVTAAMVPSFAHGRPHAGPGVACAGCLLVLLAASPARGPPPFRPTCASAACPPRASPSTSTRAWRRWRAQAAALATEILERHEARYGVARRARAARARRRRGRPQRLRHPAALSRWCTCARWPPTAATTSATTTAGCASCSTHELAHVVHLDAGARADRASGARCSAARPSSSRTRPRPTWMIEGLATYEETEGDRLRPRPQPRRRGWCCAWPRSRATSSREDRAGGRPRPLAGRAGAVPVRRGLPARPRPPMSARTTLPDLARVHSGRVLPFLDEFTARKVTGATFHALWTEWRAATRAAFEREAERDPRPRASPSRAPSPRAACASPAPRFSPDGHWIAYTDRNLTRFRSIRLVRPRTAAASTDLVKRNGGTCAGLDAGRPRPRLRRARELPPLPRAVGPARRRPGHAPGAAGSRAACARAIPTSRPTAARSCSCGSRATAATSPSLGLDGTGLRDLTRSEPGTQWSSPRWSPAGDAPRGLALPARRDGSTSCASTRRSGAVTPLTAGPGQDVEPAWTPDGAERRLPLRPRRRLEPLRAARRGRRAARASPTCSGGAFTPDVIAGRARARLRRATARAATTST